MARRNINYSVMHGGGIHLIDLISWLIGKKVEEVFAYGTKIATEKSKFNSNDTIVALLKFEDGILAKNMRKFPFCNSTFSQVIGIWYQWYFSTNSWIMYFYEFTRS